MSSSDPASSGTANSIQFVRLTDARSVLPPLLEQIPDTGGTHAYEHLDEIDPKV
jgi:hypothetical protein